MTNLDAFELLRDGARNMGNEERARWKQRVEAFLAEQRRECPHYDDCERGVAECHCRA